MVKERRQVEVIKDKRLVQVMDHHDLGSRVVKHLSSSACLREVLSTSMPKNTNQSTWNACNTGYKKADWTVLASPWPTSLTLDVFTR